ncbi:MAG: DUF1211 domain-containing protein [Acidobacteria bacterium]|nr:DUF1211 domain-containing protein [Acidobacteriota bacterium]
MIREHLFDKRAPADPLFRWRGGQVSRLEGLADGVFGLTITLVVVSTGVPTTFYELWLVVRDLPIFLASFGLLLMAWQYHYQFFRRYGLEDGWTAFLNACFLFLVLFYAYPMKFMATFLWRLILGESTRPMFEIPAGVELGLDPRVGMMIFYGVGIVGVFGVRALMTGHAYRLRDTLDLDQIERVLTMAAIRAHLITVAIACLSLSFVLLGFQPGWAGIAYFLMAPAHTVNGFYGRSKAERLRAEMDLHE